MRATTCSCSGDPAASGPSSLRPHSAWPACIVSSMAILARRQPLPSVAAAGQAHLQARIDRAEAVQAGIARQAQLAQRREGIQPADLLPGGHAVAAQLQRFQGCKAHAQGACTQACACASAAAPVPAWVPRTVHTRQLHGLMDICSAPQWSRWAARPAPGAAAAAWESGGLIRACLRRCRLHIRQPVVRKRQPPQAGQLPTAGQVCPG